MPVKFEWGGDKTASNVTKHGVTFDEASTVFGDPLAVIFDDEEHSLDEIREIIIGHSILERLLLVSFTERGEDTVRIISVRKATKRERKDHEQGPPITNRGHIHNDRKRSHILRDELRKGVDWP